MDVLPNPRGIVVSQGDPDGIGPELLLRLGAEGELGPGDRVVADPDRLRTLARRLGVAWAERGWKAVEPLLFADSLPPGCTQVEALEHAVDLVLSEPGRALVTAPIDKGKAQAEGFRHPGHTEYLAERSGVEEFAMLMVGDSIRVVLATIHVALREVPAALTVEAIVCAGRLLVEALRDHFGVSCPHVGVLGLNPHAGEHGAFGDEEARVIEPAIGRLQERLAGLASFEGPLPADSAFGLHLRRRLDAVIAMYHDQGLAPFKLLEWATGVNMTLGLPFVRTSPDHGTAKDIAGRGVAEPSSMIAAVRAARGRAP
jgi:4-hydroxythreonine-4-phosphate dehydrogenase